MIDAAILNRESFCLVLSPLVIIAALPLSFSLSSNFNFSTAHIMLQDRQAHSDCITEDQNDRYNCAHVAAIVDQTKTIHLPEVLRLYRFILGSLPEINDPLHSCASLDGYILNFLLLYRYKR